MGLFVRLTLLIALGLVALFVLALVLKTIFLAAIIAALIFAGLFAVSFVRRLARGNSGPLVPR